MARIGSESELAMRYMWLITHGVFRPTFNDPKVIAGLATPEYVDRLVREEMQRGAKPDPVLPLVA